MAIKSGMVGACLNLRHDYEVKEGMRERRERATSIAGAYGIPHWGMVAMVTDPQLAGKSLAARLTEVGLSSEDYMVMYTPGYKRFLREWKEKVGEFMEVQAVENMSTGMSEPRTRYNKGVIEQDFGIEESVFRATTAAAPSVAVQVNVGGAWERARAAAAREVDVVEGGE